MKNNTNLDRQAHRLTYTHTSFNCKNVIYANEVVTALIQIAMNTISCFTQGPETEGE